MITPEEQKPKDLKYAWWQKRFG